MKEKKVSKTNAMRFLDTNKVKYTVHAYDCDEFMDGVSIAETLNLPKSHTFKTLVTVAKSGEHYVFVLPVECELDLKKCAAAVGEKSVELINVNDILKLTGYIRGGCSPIGMKKPFKTVLHSSAQQYAVIFFSGGKRGVQIEMNPVELARLIGAEFKDIVI